jgi:hypothetical protein
MTTEPRLRMTCFRITTNKTAVGQRDRCVTMALERADRRDQSGEGREEAQAELAEDGLVVEEADRLGALDRHAVELAVKGHGAERGRQEARGPARIAERGDVTGVDELLERAAAPGPDDGRRVARAHGELDLLLVGLVLDVVDRDRVARVALLEGRDRLVMWHSSWLRRGPARRGDRTRNI